VGLDLDYLHAFGEARSCLAALADAAADEVEASHYERLLNRARCAGTGWALFVDDSGRPCLDTRLSGGCC
jgi:hypothetical protein